MNISQMLLLFKTDCCIFSFSFFSRASVCTTTSQSVLRFCNVSCRRADLAFLARFLWIFLKISRIETTISEFDKSCSERQRTSIIFQRNLINVAKLFKSKIKLLPKRKGERYASALTSMSLSNKVYKNFGKISLRNYIEKFLKNNKKK